MINANIIDFISQRLKINRRDMIEKDFILTYLLFYLTQKEEFFKNYVFKGGTCLIKCHLSYYRFSEDLDFTYLNQHEFQGKSEKQIRKEISTKINQLALILTEIAKSTNLNFKPNKNEDKFIEFGGSNAFVTFKLWYFSKELQKDTFIKIQINYKEKLEFPIKIAQAKTIIPHTLEKDFSNMFPNEAKTLLSHINIKTYDIKEILIEKIRAILTRRGTKARDYIDVYMILNSEKIELETFRKKIIDKITVMLKFEKYKSNLINKQSSNFPFKKEEEEEILLIKIDADFEDFLTKLRNFLNELIKEINYT